MNYIPSYEKMTAAGAEVGIRVDPTVYWWKDGYKTRIVLTVRTEYTEVQNWKHQRLWKGVCDDEAAFDAIVKRFLDWYDRNPE